MMERAARGATCVPLCFGTNGHIDRRKQGACKAGLLNHATSKKHNFRARITPPMFSLIKLPAPFPLILDSFELFFVEYFVFFGLENSNFEICFSLILSLFWIILFY